MKKKKSTIKYRPDSPLNYQFGGGLSFLDPYLNLGKQWDTFWKGDDYFSAGNQPPTGVYADPKAMLYNTVGNNNAAINAYNTNKQTLKDNSYTGDWGDQAHNDYYNKTLGNQYTPSQLTAFAGFEKAGLTGNTDNTAYNTWYNGRQAYANQAGAQFDSERLKRNNALAEQPGVNKQMGDAFKNTTAGIFSGLNYQNAYKAPEPIHLSQGFQGVQYAQYGDQVQSNLTGYTPGSPTELNKSNTIPGGDISMKNMKQDLIGIIKGGGKHGLITKLEKGKEYSFGSDSVTELPINPIKQEEMLHAQFGVNIANPEQLTQYARDQYLQQIAGSAQYGPSQSSAAFNNKMLTGYQNSPQVVGKPIDPYADGSIYTQGDPTMGTRPGISFKTNSNDSYLNKFNPNNSSLNTNYDPNKSSDDFGQGCPEGVDCKEEYPVINLKNDKRYEYTKDNNGNWLTRRQGTSNQWVNINTTKKLSETNRKKALTTLTNAETGKTKGNNVSVIAPRYIDTGKVADNQPLVNIPQVNTPSVQNTGALSQPQIPISSISTPTYNSNTNTTTSNNIASTILDFEDRQGSANGTHLDNYGINKDKWSKKYSYLNKNTISKKDAERFINDEYLPKVKNYPPEIQKRLVDYMYNSGRSPQDLLLYADGKITLDQINSSEVFTDKWKSYKTDIENKMNDPEFISKLNSARDNVARTTNMINGETNPAYEKTWYDRVRMFDPVKTSYNENRKIDNINSSNTNKSFSSINDRYSSDNVLSNNTPVSNPNSPANNPNGGNYDGQGNWNPSTTNKPEGATFTNKRGEVYIETNGGQIIKYTGNSYIPLKSDEEKKYKASRKNQKGDWSRVENKQYGGLVSLVPNFQFGGQINNDYTYPIHPITEEFTEIQTEKGEVVSLPDFTIVNVKADKLHKHVDKNDVTDILPAEAYVFSDDDKMKLHLDDKIGGVAIKDMTLGKSVFEYKENEITTGPKDISFSKLWGKSKELTPAQLVNNVKKKFEVRDQKDDFFVERANMENKEQRKEYLDIIKALSEFKKPKSKRVVKAQYGLNVGLPKMYNQPTNNALDGIMGYTNKVMDPYYGMDNKVKNMYNISSTMDSKLFENGGEIPHAQFGFIGAGVDALFGFSKRKKEEQERLNLIDKLRYENAVNGYVDNVQRTGAIETTGALAGYAASLNVPDLKYNDNSSALATMSDSFNRRNAMLNAQKYSALNSNGAGSSMARYTTSNNDLGAYLAAIQGNTNQLVAGVNDRQVALEGERAGTLSGLESQGLDNYNNVFNNKATQIYNANVAGMGNITGAAATANANSGQANYQAELDKLSYQQYQRDLANQAFDKSRNKIEGYANDIGNLGMFALTGGFGGGKGGDNQQMGSTNFNGQQVPSNWNSQYTSPASQQFYPQMQIPTTGSYGMRWDNNSVVPGYSTIRNNPWDLPLFYNPYN